MKANRKGFRKARISIILDINSANHNDLWLWRVLRTGDMKTCLLLFLSKDRSVYRTKSQRCSYSHCLFRNYPSDGHESVSLSYLTVRCSDPVNGCWQSLCSWQQGCGFIISLNWSNTTFPPEGVVLPSLFCPWRYSNNSPSDHCSQITKLIQYTEGLTIKRSEAKHTAKTKDTG